MVKIGSTWRHNEKDELLIILGVPRESGAMTRYSVRVLNGNGASYRTCGERELSENYNTMGVKHGRQ